MATSTRRPAARLFGTDGIRGAFGRFPLDEPTVTSLGRCLGHLLQEDNAALPLVVLGGDTRESTPTITRWLDHGLRSMGASVRHAGTIPTPGIARAVKHLGADAGVVISASHNPYPDNGIKIFDRHGFKFDSRAEQRLEERLHDQPDVPSSQSQRGPDPTAPEPELAAHYRETTLGTLTDPQALRHLRIVLDAGNGAASTFAASLFEAAGATQAPA